MVSPTAAGNCARQRLPGRPAAIHNIASSRIRWFRTKEWSERLAGSMKNDNTCAGTEAQSNHSPTLIRPPALGVLGLCSDGRLSRSVLFDPLELQMVGPALVDFSYDAEPGLLLPLRRSMANGLNHSRTRPPVPTKGTWSSSKQAC